MNVILVSLYSFCIESLSKGFWLHLFCSCPSHIRDIDPRALKGVFLGYSNSQKGYKCFHPPSGKYYVSMDVQFNERESYFSKDVDMVPFQGEINSKEEERLWLEEKRWWISSKEEDFELDNSQKPESK